MQPDFSAINDPLKLVSGDDASVASYVGQRALQIMQQGVDPQTAVFAAANEARQKGIVPQRKPSSEIGRIMSDVNSGLLSGLTPQQAITQGTQAAASAGVPVGNIANTLLQGAFSKAANLPAGTTIDPQTGQIITQPAAIEAAAATEQAKVTGRARGEIEAAKNKNTIKFLSQSQQMSRVNDAINKAAEQADMFTTGTIGSVASLIPGSPAYDLSKTIETISANLAFDELQKMRDNSPTGGALGNVTEMELNLLKSTLANLSQSQSTEQFKRNLEILRGTYQQSMQRIAEAYKLDYGEELPLDFMQKQNKGAMPARNSGSFDDLGVTFEKIGD